MVKISVIMSVYNADKYLEIALESLVHQTLKEIEIICIDDDSTDLSRKILNKYAERDSRIVILPQDKSFKEGAKNLGIQYATGEYLSILEPNDIFELNMLEAAYEKAKREAADICVFKTDEFVEDIRYRKACPKALSKEQLPDFEPFTYKDITENIFTVFKEWTGDKLFRRAFVLENKLVFQDFGTTGSMLFTFTAFLRAERISILGRTLMHRRIRQREPWNCCYQELLSLREELTKIGIYKEVERSYINYALFFSLQYLNALTPPEFQTLYKKLKNEIFEELGISGKRKKYFWDEENYERYRQIKSLCAEKYRILNGMQPKYKRYPCRARKMEKVEKPKVSIIVPIYNVEQYLIECLNSVVNQTLDDIEIICVNDGSTDSSLKIIKRFAEYDKRILILDGPNGGYGKAMNRGLDVATGDYIGIVEPDDYVALNMYETLYEIAVEKKLDLIKADFNRFKEAKRKRQFVREQIANRSPKLYNQVVSPREYPIVFTFTLNTWSGIYKRSFINDNQIRHNETPGASYQDNGFWFQTFCFAERMYFLNQPYYQCRRDNPNSSIYDKAKVYCMCEEYQYIYDFLEKHPEFKQRYIGYYQLRRYYNYMFTLERIAAERKLEFVNRFYEEFKDAYEKHELMEEVFDDLGWDMIQELLASPMDFYAHFIANGEAIQLRQEIKKIRTSKSWKIGSAVVYLPKKILGR